MRTESRNNCLLCGRKGKPLYANLSDVNYATKGSWGILRCPECGLAWLSPKPISEDIKAAYPLEYGTHAHTKVEAASIREVLFDAIVETTYGYEPRNSKTPVRLVGVLSCAFPTVWEAAKAEVMWLRGRTEGNLLDIGAGSGTFANKMRKLGWHVSVVEPDERAASIAREVYGLDVITGTLENSHLPRNHYDAITLSHVIEHVEDPVGVLRICKEALSQSGILVVATPNFRSLGHLCFGESWYGLDPPRHLSLFTSKTLAMVAQKAGIEILELRSTPRLAWWTFGASKYHTHRQVYSGRGSRRMITMFRAMVFQLWEWIFTSLGLDLGEELVMKATRQREASSKGKILPLQESLSGQGANG